MVVFRVNSAAKIYTNLIRGKQTRNDDSSDANIKTNCTYIHIHTLGQQRRETNEEKTNSNSNRRKNERNIERSLVTRYSLVHTNQMRKRKNTRIRDVDQISLTLSCVCCANQSYHTSIKLMHSHTALKPKKKQQHTEHI